MHFTIQLQGGSIYFDPHFAGTVIMVGKPSYEEHEAAAHIASMSRKQRLMDAGSLLMFFFTPFKTPGHMLVLPIFQVTLSPSTDPA